MRKHIIIIGVHKAGTSSLFEILSNHPEVVQSKIKETHFFSALDNEKWSSKHEDYDKFFSDDVGIRLEASPEYFYMSDTGIEHMDSMLRGDVHYVLILRKPTEKIVSSYKHMKSKGIVSNWDDFRERELNECKLQSYHKCPGGFELTQCFYEEHLKRWLRFQDCGRLSIFDFEAFKLDPLSVACEILSINGLANFGDKLPERLHANKSVTIKNQTIHKFAMWLFHFFETWLRRNPVFKAKIAQRYNRLNTNESKEDIDVSDYLYLDMYYNSYFNK